MRPQSLYTHKKTGMAVAGYINVLQVGQRRAIFRSKESIKSVLFYESVYNHKYVHRVWMLFHFEVYKEIFFIK
ncbi:hypothetical protein SUGI_0635350 [Cryptomeria japonica]|nr:hypothetical protein SUGI_0635350 [Cryptomeria japonica]